MTIVSGKGISNAINLMAEAASNTEEFFELKKAKKNLGNKYDSLINDLTNKQDILSNSYLSQEEAERLMLEVTEDYRRLNQIQEMQNYFRASDKFDEVFSSMIQSLHTAIKNKI